MPAVPDAALDQVIRRNTVILGSTFAIGWAVIQLQSALTAVTTEVLTGETAVAGVGSALFLVALGLVAVPAGRLMDRIGRGPVLALGFLVATGASGVLFGAVEYRFVPLFFGALVVLGLGLGTVNLARVGAADMAPPHERASRVGRVLLGAAVGAILGPIVFSPLLSNRVGDPSSLAAPWIVAAALSAIGAGVVLAMRRDPLSIARELGAAPGAAPAVAGRRSLRLVYTDPTLRTGLLAVVVAQVVMASAMSVVGLEMHHRGQDLGAISVALGVHLVGMFGLAPVLGRVADAVGRRPAMSLGLVVVATGAIGLALGPTLSTVLPSIFLVGVGWNLAYLSGTALVADATSPHERASALGALDLGGLVGAALTTVLAPAVLDVAGLGPLVVAGAAMALVPAVLLFNAGRLAPATR